MKQKVRMTRRSILQAAFVAPLGTAATAAAVPASSAPEAPADPVSAFPMRCVTLRPSPYLDALRVNRAYLLELKPDRLLHGFRVQAGLAPRAAAYGGWEADTIAGHTLGHYLSALSLLHAQTGDSEAATRVRTIVGELELCQRQQPDGYIAAFTRRRDGRIEDGRLVFEEVRRGDIRVRPFNLNGGWSPLYNWHKLIAGLLDADQHCGDAKARTIAIGLAGYIDGVFAVLDDAQTQAVLGCEYGGLNESMAELHVRTGDARWGALAARLNDRKTLEPLQQGHDDLAGLHANTMIAKVIGQARLYETVGAQPYRISSETFWQAVTQHHAFAIGGTGDGEYFAAADATATHLSDRTCETCASYNMLKLTRQIYGWKPNASHFDYYERTQINHILAQQHPRTGMFTYMMPVAAGAPRQYSDPVDDFWCCVGTGMESHAKHGDSIWWHRQDELFVNLFIPSELAWREREALLVLETSYPHDGRITVRIDRMGSAEPLTIAMRVPAWAGTALLSLNGVVQPVTRDLDGYVRVRRSWSDGDTLCLQLDLTPRLEVVPNDPHKLVVLHGPMVLAADLGPAGARLPYHGAWPTLVARDPLAALRLVDARTTTYEADTAISPTPLILRPFALQHDRRSAPYLEAYTPAGWSEAASARTGPPSNQENQSGRIDRLVPGDARSVRHHDLKGAGWHPIIYRGHDGWHPGPGETIEALLRLGPHPTALQVTYYDDDVCRSFRILVNGVPVATEILPGRNPGVFYQKRYLIPDALVRGATRARIRFEPAGERGVGMLFGIESRLATS